VFSTEILCGSVCLHRLIHLLAVRGHLIRLIAHVVDKQVGFGSSRDGVALISIKQHHGGYSRAGISRHSQLGEQHCTCQYATDMLLEGTTHNHTVIRTNFQKLYSDQW
jgi:hypothetical protein